MSANANTQNNFKAYFKQFASKNNPTNMPIDVKYQKSTSTLKLSKENINKLKFNNLDLLLLTWCDMIHDATGKDTNPNSAKYHLKVMTLSTFVHKHIYGNSNNKNNTNSIRQVYTLIKNYKDTSKMLNVKKSDASKRKLFSIVDNNVQFTRSAATKKKTNPTVDLGELEDKLTKHFMGYTKNKTNVPGVYTKDILVPINKIRQVNRGIKNKIPVQVDMTQGSLENLSSQMFQRYLTIAGVADAGLKMLVNWASLSDKVVNPHPLEFNVGDSLAGKIYIKKVDSKWQGYIKLTWFAGFEINRDFPIAPKSVGGLGKFFGDFAQILYSLAYKQGLPKGSMFFATGDRMAAIIYLFMSSSIGKNPALIFEVGKSHLAFYAPNNKMNRIRKLLNIYRNPNWTTENLNNLYTAGSATNNSNASLNNSNSVTLRKLMRLRKSTLDGGFSPDLKLNSEINRLTKKLKTTSKPKGTTSNIRRPNSKPKRTNSKPKGTRPETPYTVARKQISMTQSREGVNSILDKISGSNISAVMAKRLINFGTVRKSTLSSSNPLTYNQIVTKYRRT